jgi:hypothetical protein
MSELAVRGRPFPPGVSGNPNGRPLGHHTRHLFSEAFMRDLSEIVEDSVYASPLSCPTATDMSDAALMTLVRTIVAADDTVARALNLTSASAALISRFS